jgi:t-SNARE complex subunit (syntaxin)
MPELLNKINNMISFLGVADYKDSSHKIKVDEQIKIINEKLQPKRGNLPNLINRIVDKEGKVAKKLSIKNPEDVEAINNSFNSYDPRNSGEFSQSSFRESKLVVKELVDQGEYLKQRQEALEDIKKVSGQIKEISATMKVEIHQQGENLTIAETHIEKANENTKKAELEISEAEKITRKSGRCLCWTMFLIVFFILSAVTIFLVLLLK